MKDLMFLNKFEFYSTVETELLKSSKQGSFAFQNNSGSNGKDGLRWNKLRLETVTVVSERDDTSLNLVSGKGDNVMEPRDIYEAGLDTYER